MDSKTPQAWFWWVLCSRGCSDRRISENYEGDPKWFEETCKVCGAKMTVLDCPPPEAQTRRLPRRRRRVVPADPEI